MGISNDRVEIVLRRAQDILLPQATWFVIINCGTNNVDQNQPKDIAVAIIKIVEAFTKKYPKVNIIITGVLTSERRTLFGEQKPMRKVRY